MPAPQPPPPPVPDAAPTPGRHAAYQAVKAALLASWETLEARQPSIALRHARAARDALPGPPNPALTTRLRRRAHSGLAVAVGHLVEALMQACAADAGNALPAARSALAVAENYLRLLGADLDIATIAAANVAPVRLRRRRDDRDDWPVPTPSSEAGPAEDDED